MWVLGNVIILVFDSNIVIRDERKFTITVRIGVTIWAYFFNPGIQDISNPGIPGFFGIVFIANKTLVECQFGKFREGIYVFNLILGKHKHSILNL